MPCQPDEEEAPRNDGAGYDNSDAEFPLSQSESKSSDEEEEERPKQKRKRVVAEYELVTRWVTGQVIEVSTLICICGRRPSPGIKHERVCHTPFIVVLSLTPMLHPCKCMKTIRVGR
jgi:hypothetical protein